MSRFNKYFPSTENLGDTNIIASADQTLEEESLIVAENVAETNESTADAEQFIEAEEGLEALKASIEHVKENGHLDSTSAMFLGHALRGYGIALGTTFNVPSTESIGPSGYRDYLDISLEGIGDILKRIWDAIKTAISRAITMIKNLFAKLFGGVEKLRSRHAALSKSVKDMKEKVDITIPSVTHLRYNNKDDIASIVTGLKATADCGKIVLEPVLNSVDKALDSIMQDILGVDIKSTWMGLGKDKATGKAETDQGSSARSNGFWGSVKTAFTSNLKSSYSSLTKVHQISGDKRFEITSEKDMESGETTVQIPKLVGDSKASSMNEGTKAEKVSKGQVSDVLSATGDIITQLEKNKGRLESLTKKREAIQAKGDKFVADAAKIHDGNEAVISAQLKIGLRMAGRDYTQPINQYAAHAFNVARAGLALADRAIGGQGKAKE